MVYLDNAATMPLLEPVKKAMHEAEERFFANASALHTPGHLALNEIEKCRELLAEMIGAKPSEIIFTSGATESNNTVIRTFEGHQIECSPMEHHSLLESARLYRGKKLPKLYSYMLVNNETGEYIYNEKIKPSQNSHIHSDLTQALGKIPIDVNKLGLDYATFSAHKIGGPIGVGALYVRDGAPFKPLLVGGNQEHKRRGGTYNTVGIVGFRVALETVLMQNWPHIYDTKVRKLRDTLARKILDSVPDSSLNTDLSHDASVPGIFNMSFEGAEGESIQLYLDAEGIIVSTGSACAAGDTKPSHVLMAKTGDAEVAHSSIRFSFGPYNTSKDIDYVMKILPPIIDKLQKISTVSRRNNEQY